MGLGGADMAACNVFGVHEMSTRRFQVNDDRKI